MAKKFQPHQINKVSLHECHLSDGCIVVIDVLRAFTTAAFAFGSGAEEILTVSTIEEAFAMKEKDPNLLLMGEDMGRPIPGFDFGNSPVQISQSDLTGKRLVQRTTAGTQGVVRSKNAKQILTASFSVAEATYRQILRWMPEKVTFVITGTKTGDEDLALADYLEQKLLGRRPDPEPYLKRVVDAPESLGIQSKSYFKDVQIAVLLDYFPFAMQVFEGNSMRKIIS
ncbi:MAG: 2-phosphosulfolactate phosphatase [Parachlamydiales bacterium]|nr:2-phosphosulfolactate phosphatase [Parachlamydiales bacterium]